MKGGYVIKTGAAPFAALRCIEIYKNARFAF